ncbi:hypothetical protein KSP40_PGU017455 [Platanthera guangdongensis]|uniref:Tify domain-containing protein n=1 Tax=Platanthera guangdongensis TaxID=2320717 RepID=A0ABR2M5V6_9ASPA
MAHYLSCWSVRLIVLDYDIVSGIAGGCSVFCIVGPVMVGADYQEWARVWTLVGRRSSGFPWDGPGPNGQPKQVVSSLKFEKHGGSRSHNQNAHISLENGISLYVLSKELTNVSLDSLGRMIAEKFGYPTIMKDYKD